MREENFEKSIEKTEKISKRVRNIGWFFVALGFVGLIIGIFYWLKFGGKLNEVGDFVGGISGSLWALAGLFFIYVAFLGQKIEIKYQQEELKLNREELRESKEVFKAQANIMLDQKLDTTFFNLLDNHRKLVDSFKRGKSKRIGKSHSMFDTSNQITETVSGYDVLENIYSSLKWYLKEYSNFLTSRNIFSTSILKSNPVKEIKRYRDIEILYNEVSGIVEFVSKKIREENKEFYLNTLFNNLSNQEKFLLAAYNRNCSNNLLKELDFDGYLRYNFKDFDKEKSFISFRNFFLKFYSSETQIDVKIEFFEEQFQDYEYINLYLINILTEEIKCVGKITIIMKEIIITQTLKNIAEQNIQNLTSSIYANDVKDLILLSAKSLKNNFMLHVIYKIALEKSELKLFNYDDPSPDWIQNHFNNIENQES